MGSGKSDAAENASIQNAQQQTQLGQQQVALSGRYADIAQGELARRTELEQPKVNFLKDIASGNQRALLTAMGPQLGAISQQAQQAQSNIYNTVSPGAGRDYALARTQQDKGTAISEAINRAFTGGLEGLSQMGGEALGAGLQQEGATLSGAAGATNSFGSAIQAYGNIQQTEAQRKSATMGFLGELAGAGGKIGAAGVSDVRLKEEIEKVGEIGDVNLYSFRFKDTGERDLGFMAQEVFTKHPEDVEVGGEDPSVNPWKVRYGTLLPKLMGDK